MQIAIIGTGYVGLVSGVCLAERGHDVVCVDVDAEKVARINAGRATIHEDGLPELLSRHAGRRLRATTDLASAVRAAELVFIAVGTPAAGGRIDLSQVEQASEAIGSAMRDERRRRTVIVKSTVIPGTTDGLVRQAVERASGRRAGADFGLGMNPEFLTEGRAVRDFLEPDRLVFGGVDAATHEALESVYGGFAGVPRIRSNNATAEFIKYASNAVLATLISFSNEIARLCAATEGVDVVEVMRGVHASAYFTTRASGQAPITAAITDFLEAGCGFGGSCLPKDVAALVARGHELGIDLPLLHSVLLTNEIQLQELYRLLSANGARLEGLRVTVLGLAFKSGTDDLRESPALPLLRRLREGGAAITAYDPLVLRTEHEALAGVRLARSLSEAVSEAEVVVLVTRWPQFEALPEALAASGRKPLVVDGRRVLRAGDFARYVGIGLSERQN